MWLLPVPLSPRSTTGSAGLHVAAAGQGGDGGRVDGGGRPQVEIGQALHAREAGLGHPPLTAALRALVHFSRQDFGQEPQVGRLGTLGHLGQAGGVGAHHGQAQLPGGGPDGSQGGGVGHGHAEPSSSWS